MERPLFSVSSSVIFQSKAAYWLLNGSHRIPSLRYTQSLSYYIIVHQYPLVFHISLLFHIFHYILITSPFTMESIMWFYSDMFFDIPWHDHPIVIQAAAGSCWTGGGSWMSFHRQKFYAYAAGMLPERGIIIQILLMFFFFFSKRNNIKLFVCISDGNCASFKDFGFRRLSSSCAAHWRKVRLRPCGCHAMPCLPCSRDFFCS